MKKNALRTIAFTAALLIFTAVFAGCDNETNKGDTPMYETAELTRVEYAFNSGTMMGADFSIDITSDKIIETSFYSQEINEQIIKEDMAVTQQQWKAIEDAVLTICPLLEEVKPVSQKPSVIDIHVLDGGDAHSFYLTWKSEGNETRVCYRIPNDRRFSTLVSLLRETADPIGREIIYFDAPELVGFYVFRDSVFESKKFSYQCTLKGSDTDERYFFAYFYENGQSASFNATVYADTWEKIKAECEAVGVEGLENGRSDKKIFCTLYYSDGKQRTVNPDKQTALSLKAFFEELVNGIKAEQ